MDTRQKLALRLSLLCLFCLGLPHPTPLLGAVPTSSIYTCVTRSRPLRLMAVLLGFFSLPSGHCHHTQQKDDSYIIIGQNERIMDNYRLFDHPTGPVPPDASSSPDIPERAFIVKKDTFTAFPNVEEGEASGGALDAAFVGLDLEFLTVDDLVQKIKKINDEGITLGTDSFLKRKNIEDYINIEDYVWVEDYTSLIKPMDEDSLLCKVTAPEMKDKGEYDSLLADPELHICTRPFCFQDSFSRIFNLDYRQNLFYGILGMTIFFPVVIAFPVCIAIHFFRGWFINLCAIALTSLKKNYVYCREEATNVFVERQLQYNLTVQQVTKICLEAKNFPRTLTDTICSFLPKKREDILAMHDQSQWMSMEVYANTSAMLLKQGMIVACKVTLSVSVTFAFFLMVYYKALAIM